MDGGPILAQRAVEVGVGETLDSLEARIHAAEHRLFPATVRRFLAGPCRREGRRIVFGAGARENAHA